MTATPRETRWLLVVVLPAVLAGACLSLLGPAIYGEDQDRHLVQTVLLLEGDLGLLGRGLLVSGGHHTLSGLFFALLAPAMAISGHPEWLWSWMDLLVLLGAIPLWFLARSLASGTVAWIAVALYVASSGRIEHSWLGIHSSVVIPLGILGHLALVRYLDSGRRRDLVAAAAVLAVCLSLHLSYLPMLVAGSALILWSRWPALARRPALAEVSPGVVAAAVAAWVLGAIVLLLGVLGWGVRELRGVAVNLLFALAEHTGPSAPSLRGGDWSYAPYPGKAAAAALAGLPVLLAGVVTLWGRRTALPGWLGIPPGRVPMLRRWVLVMALVQLGAALAGIDAWKLTADNVWRYRHITALVPVVMILITLGLAGIGEWVASLMSRPGLARPVTLTMVGTVAALHLLVLAVAYRQAPWRVSGPAVLPELSEVVETTRARWQYDQAWFGRSVFTDALEGPSMGQPRHEYLLRWLFRDRTTGPAADPPGPDKVMYVARPGGVLQREVLAREEILDSAVTTTHVAYLCRRRAGALPDAAPLLLTYGPREEDRYLLGPDPRELIGTGAAAPPEGYALIAANVELPESVPEVLAEVVVEEDPGHLAIGARLYGRGLDPGSMGEGIQGPHLVIHHRNGRVIRLSFSDRPGDATSQLSVVDTLRGWSARDVAAVFVGVDRFRNPGNPWEGIPPHDIPRQVVRLR